MGVFTKKDFGPPPPTPLTRYEAAWTLGIFACRWNKELPGPEKVMSKQEDLPTYVPLSIMDLHPTFREALKVRPVNGHGKNR